MTTAFPSYSAHSDGSLWLQWFAKESKDDLELDEGLDEFDDEHPKPPSRRPLLIILLLLLVGGAGYVAMNPDLLSSVTNMIAAPGAHTAEEEAMNDGHDSQATPAPDLSDTPSPSFGEGAVVSVRTKQGEHGPIRLSRDAQGSGPGPMVQVGELLTILDGTFINHTWIYMVNTKSGATGWIDEHHLQSPS